MAGVSSELKLRERIGDGLFGKLLAAHIADWITEQEYGCIYRLAQLANTDPLSATQALLARAELRKMSSNGLEKAVCGNCTHYRGRRKTSGKCTNATALAYRARVGLCDWCREWGVTY